MICVAAGVYRPPEKQGQDAKDHKMSIFSDCDINYILMTQPARDDLKDIATYIAKKEF
jgi:hypothetical protein